MKKIIKQIDRVFMLLISIVLACGIFYISKVSWWQLFPDESLYAGYARGFWFNFPLPLIRDEFIFYAQPVYPMLISPLAGILNGLSFYHATGFFNMFLFSLSSVPIYCLTMKLFSNKNMARFVGVASIITPWVVMMSQITPGGLGFLCFWTMILVNYNFLLRKPQLSTKINWIFILILMANFSLFLIRAQFIFMAPVFILSLIINYKIVYKLGIKNILYSIKETGFFVVILILAIIILNKNILGIYQATFDDQVFTITSLAKMFTYNLSSLNISTFVISFALTTLYLARVFIKNKYKKLYIKESIFSINMLLVVFFLILTVSGFFSLIGNKQILDHYLMYLAPFFFIGVAGFLIENNNKRFSVLSIISSTLLFFGFTFVTHLVYINTPLYSPGAYWLGRGQSLLYSMGSILNIRIAFLMVLTLVIMFTIIRIRNNKSPGIIIIPFIIVSLIISSLMAMKNSITSTRDNRMNNPTWVDNSLPRDAMVGMFMNPVTIDFKYSKPGVIDKRENTEDSWSIEFWNKKVRKFYSNVIITKTVPGGKEIKVNKKTGNIEAKDLPEWILMSNQNYVFFPEYTQKIKHNNLFLLKLAPSKKASWASYGLTSTGWAKDNNGKIIVFNNNNDNCFKMKINYGYDGESNSQLYQMNKQLVVIREKKGEKIVDKCFNNYENVTIPFNRNYLGLPSSDYPNLRLANVEIIK